MRGNRKKGGKMLVWCITLFCLGIIAFMDSLFNYGDIFRRINSIVFMLVSLGLLIRTSVMARMGHKEELSRRNEELEKQTTDPGRTHASEKEPAPILN